MQPLLIGAEVIGCMALTSVTSEAVGASERSELTAGGLASSR